MWNQKLEYLILITYMHQMRESKVYNATDNGPEKMHPQQQNTSGKF